MTWQTTKATPMRWRLGEVTAYLDSSVTGGDMEVLSICRRAPPARFPRIPKGWKLAARKRDGDQFTLTCYRMFPAEKP